MIRHNINKKDRVRRLIAVVISFPYNDSHSNYNDL